MSFERMVFLVERPANGRNPAGRDGGDSRTDWSPAECVSDADDLLPPP
jgi:hypothetical protein